MTTASRIRLTALAVPVLLALPAVVVSGTHVGQPARPARQLSIRSPLRVSAANPRYFADGGGRVVLLTGSHTWEDLQDGGTHDPPPAFDYERFINTLAAEGHNFFRMWRWEQARGNAGTSRAFTISPSAYARTGPGIALDGKPRFDVTRFDDEYFARLRRRVLEAREKGIYTSIMLFDGWSIEPKHVGNGNPWLGHPFNRLNNVNGVDGDPDHDDSGSETHTLALPSITALQEAYVRRVIDAVNDLDNVLYEISNESSPESTAWQYHMIRFVKSYEATKPKQHPVGMTAEYPRGANEVLLDSPADWVSLNTPADAGSAAVPADGRKVLIDDTDHLCGVCGSTEWAWISFLSGRNPLFMDPFDGEDGLTYGVDPRGRQLRSLRNNLGYIRAYADRIDLARATPHPELASSGFCLAIPDSAHAEYLVYITGGLRPPLRGLRVSLDLRASPRRLAVEWFSPRFERVVARDSIEGGATRQLRAPFLAGDAVLYLHP